MMKTKTMIMLSLWLAGPLLLGRDIDRSGRLYGTVTMKSGTQYQGTLRWGTEEAFWDDVFNSSKVDLDYQDLAPKREKTRKKSLKIFGITISTSDWIESSGRQFMCQFGAIDQIKVTGSEAGIVVLKTGREVAIDGGANDVGGEIRIQDETIGSIDVRWHDIDHIQFLPTPKDLDSSCIRLFGVVDTTVGRFEGFVQWDAQESMGQDELDGESPDGDVSIKMDRIASIERISSASCRVVIFDGRAFTLRGTNDVNDENRGIYVEDPRFGRVKIDWDQFDEVVFKEVATTGRGYAQFQDYSKLHGTVIDKSGRESRGTLVFDLDEEETWEMLNGSVRNIEYLIPFQMVAVLEPQNRDETRVRLKNGETLTLSDAADVNEENLGVAVLDASGQNTGYIPWADIVHIELE